MIRGAALALLLLCGAANAQNVLVPTRPVGDSTNAAASTQFVQQNLQSTANLSSSLDIAFGSTRGGILERGASGWQLVAPSATVGLPWVSNGAGADPAYQALTGPALSVPFTQPITISANLATVANFGYNPISIGILATDSASCTCPTPGQNIPTLLTVQENMGGSSINNGRNAFSAFLTVTSATSATNPYRFYVASNAYSQALSADNGTGGTPLGTLEGLTSAFRLANGATNWKAGIGMEVLTDVETGASVVNKAALLLDTFSTDTVQGTGVDTWVWTYSFSGAVGKNTWLQIDSAGGVFGLTSTASVIKLVAAGGGSTISTGFDFGSVAVTNNILQWASSAWLLAGNGNATLNTVTTSNHLFPSGLVSVGTCTGMGTTGSCAVATGSSRQIGKVVLTSAGTGQTTSGALTLTFTGGLGADDSSCVFFPQNGTGAWATATTMQGQTSSPTSAVAIWQSAAAPVAGNNYLVEYRCGGM